MQEMLKNFTFVINALERARAIHEKRKMDVTEFDESVTTIYELVLRPNVFDEDSITGEFKLYEKL